MNLDELTRVENESIRAFVDSCSEHLTGRVLDYGCGARPYQSIIEAAGGDYWGHDDPTYPGASAYVKDQQRMGSVYYGSWNPLEEASAYDAILCTQVIEYAYWRGLGGFLFDFKEGLKDGGYLVMTGPTNWPEVEVTDRVRFTLEGIAKEVRDAGFEVIRLESRWSIPFDGWEMSMGWGCICRA